MTISRLVMRLRVGARERSAKPRPFRPDFRAPRPTRLATYSHLRVAERRRIHLRPLGIWCWGSWSETACVPMPSCASFNCSLKVLCSWTVSRPPEPWASEPASRTLSGRSCVPERFPATPMAATTAIAAAAVGSTRPTTPRRRRDGTTKCTGGFSSGSALTAATTASNSSATTEQARHRLRWADRRVSSTSESSESSRSEISWRAQSHPVGRNRTLVTLV